MGEKIVNEARRPTTTKRIEVNSFARDFLLRSIFVYCCFSTQRAELACLLILYFYWARQNGMEKSGKHEDNNSVLLHMKLLKFLRLIIFAEGVRAKLKADAGW